MAECLPRVYRHPQVSRWRHPQGHKETQKEIPYLDTDTFLPVSLPYLQQVLLLLLLLLLLQETAASRSPAAGYGG